MLGTAELFQIGKFQTVAWRNFNLRAKSQLTVRPPVPEAIQMQVILKAGKSCSRKGKSAKLKSFWVINMEAEV